MGRKRRRQMLMMAVAAVAVANKRQRLDPIPIPALRIESDLERKGWNDDHLVRRVSIGRGGRSSLGAGLSAIADAMKNEAEFERENRTSEREFQREEQEKQRGFLERVLLSLTDKTAEYDYRRWEFNEKAKLEEKKAAADAVRDRERREHEAKLQLDMQQNMLTAMKTMMESIVKLGLMMNRE
mmetsp:Transcript_36776/g.62014  ORF Transcript_36776/g.62014 Transcript_36776/m.62014 type:complete len:183 (+) Transcript_36776:55-603(+)